MKRIISLFLVVLCIGGVTVFAKGAVTVSSECDISDINVPLDNTPANAAIGQTLDIKAKSAVLMEPNTGRVLYENNPDEKLPPASITKIMSLLLVMEAIDRGDLSLETVVTASEHAASMGGSQIWLEPGETMTVNDLLKASVIASANDACTALAEAVAGSEEGFVALMNERAAELGMTNTHFKNCTGLDAEGHLTSAYDVAVMSSALIKHKLIKDYTTVWMDSLRDGKSELVNTNKLVRFYEGTTGLKTGTTSTAKYCVSATAERNGLELVAVVMAGETTKERFNGAKKLLDYGFANYNYSVISADLGDTKELDIAKGTQKKIAISAEKQLSVLLPKTAKGNIAQEISFNENITAPIKKGAALGTVTVKLGDETLGEIPVTAAEGVERLSLSFSLRQILKGLFQL